MKTKLYFAPRTTRHALAVALLSTFTTFYVAQPSTVFAQGTAFTYQGRLQNNGSPANGSYDLTFGLFNASSSGSQVGNTLTNSATGVTNGLFNITLDFGTGVFTGDARWLEIAARTNGAALFTTLAPRQQLLPTPYAIMANSASNLLGTLPTAQLGAGTANINISGNAAGFTGSLSGNVTGTQGATVVSTVGGQTAANVASGVSAANAATSANTASTIVKRDGSGNFSAGTITASLSGNATTANNFSGSLAGNVTGTQGATVVSTVGGQTAANVASGVIAAMPAGWTASGGVTTSNGTNYLNLTSPTGNLFFRLSNP
jgi:hypothetical protein